MPAALGMLHGQYVDGFTFDSVIQLLVTHPKLITEVISLRSGPSLAFGRNKMTEVFMESTDSDWLFCLDSDMVFQPEQIEDLIKKEGINPKNTICTLRVARALDNENKIFFKALMLK